MASLSIHTTTGDSQILTDTDGLIRVSEWLKENHYNSKVALITDSNVGKIYQEAVEATFPEALILTVKAGEESKRMEVAERLCLTLLNDEFTRSDVVVGFGGGMVTDLAGFVASIYMRGIPYVAVPTSLLAMVDAAIGGKTGVNLEAKNIVGTFHPAELVMIDSKFLDTLPERELTSGMAEVIKYAAILDAGLEAVLMADPLDYNQILEKSLRCKVNVCNEDLKEGGLRKVLNFGHTLGHAIEELSQYRLTHGEAISIGMTLANKVAQKLGKQQKETGNRITTLLEKYGLPTALPKTMTLEEVVDMVRKDKKMEAEKVSFILSCDMGKHEIVKLTLKELMQLL